MCVFWCRFAVSMAPYEVAGCISENSEAQNQSAHFITRTHTFHTEVCNEDSAALFCHSDKLQPFTTLFTTHLHCTVQYSIHYTDLYPEFHLILLVFENDIHEHRLSCVFLISGVL